MRRLVRALVGAAALVGVVAPAALRRSRRETLVWGPVPILNNRYWSEAMKAGGQSSLTLMREHYAINRPEDYDLYFDDVVPAWIRPAPLRRMVAPYFAERFVLRRASVLHTPFSGGPLAETPFWRLEAPLLRRAGVRTVVIPYGADVYRYSLIDDPSLRAGLAASYPQTAHEEAAIGKRVDYWSRRADAIVIGFTVEGVPRRDLCVGNIVCIDTAAWTPKAEYSRADGRSGAVRVLHTSNHRGFKGTEYLLEAVERLRAEGLGIDLVLLEGVGNERVRSEMLEADVLADQFMASAYGLAAIEAMASGLPVVANLDAPEPAGLFRRTSFLGECPIVSATLETVEAVLRRLVTEPELREQLGRAGRAFAEKYQSYDMAQYVFESLYDWLEGADVNLPALFDPATSPYVRRRPRVQHPLVDSRLPGT